MRTTLTLDDDLARVLEREAKAKQRSFKEIVNTTLRLGLAAQVAAVVRTRPKVITRPHDFGTKPGLDFDKMNQLIDELETDEFVKKNRGWMNLHDPARP